VYFVANGQLVVGEPAGVTQGLYVWHDGAIRYIGRFDDSNLAAFNTSATAWEFVSATRTSRVSPDGRHLLFMAMLDDGFRGRGGYAGYDHGSSCGNPCRELYLYSADSGRLTCVSCNPLATVATGDALTDLFPGVSASLTTQHLSNALSDDGQHVFFTTTEGLVVEDANGKADAYEYDVASGRVHLISSGTSASDSYFMDASSDGKNAFFVTRQRLVGWDIDDSYDLYDARVGGGFPDPVPGAQPCLGEGCRGAVAGAPGAAAGASAQFRGAGDQAARLRKHKSSSRKPKRCRGRAVLRRVRGKRKCVRLRRHRGRRGRLVSGGRAPSERSGR
jgi:hypothetical protein